MDRSNNSNVFVGNEFLVPQKQPRTTVASPSVQRTPARPAAPRPVYAQPVLSRPARPVVAPQPVPITVQEPRSIPQEITVITLPAAPRLAPAMTLQPTMPALSLKPLADLKSLPRRGFNVFHSHSIIAFSLLVLLVGSTGISVYANYRNAAIENSATPAILNAAKAPSIAGLSKNVPAAELDAKVAAITAQAAKLTVGDQPNDISPETIKSWLVMTPVKDKSEVNVRVNSAAITKSVTDIANKYEKAPVNQITSTASGTPQVIATGRNGLHLSNINSIKEQTTDVAKTLIDAKGFAFSTPLDVAPFAAVTPAAYPKMIEINVDSKQMYLFENGQVTHTYPISAGAPETPTPIGQYKIFSKLSTQDMSGYNANGTKYFQPHVRWINYFLPGGYAIHGNYWRPTSWFGNINSSHGCASLPDAQAKEVYDWAPMGTPVVTHHN